MMKHKAFKIILASMLLVSLSLGTSNAQQKEKENTKKDLPPAQVSIKKIVPTMRELKGISENSTLEAIDQVTLYPRVSGRLMKMCVKQGQKVSKGTAIAELDHRDVDAQIAQARAQIAVAQAQVAQARAELENAKRERDRYRRLLKEGFSTQQQLDEKETTYRTRKAAVDLSIAQVRQYEANLDRLNVDLSEYTIRSSIDGIVLNDYSRTPGEMITPQTTVADVADVSRLKAVIKAPEAHAEIIKEGMTAFVTIAGNDKKFEGKVYRVSPFVNIDTRTTQVEVSVDNKESGGILKPGMFARVFIVERALEDSILIPQTALIERDGKNYVPLYVDGKAHIQEVETGIVVGEKIEIKNGLSQGMLLIVSGGMSLEEGDPIEAKEAK